MSGELNLPRQVHDEVGVEPRLALRGLGAVFAAVRMSMNAEQFEPIRDAIPQVDEWIRAVPIGGGRTGEMLAVIGPDSLRRDLTEIGFTAKQITTLGAIVGRALQMIDRDTASVVAAKLPFVAAA